MARRFRWLQNEITQWIEHDDELGLAPVASPRRSLVKNARGYAFATDSEKLGAFQQWLKEKVDKGILGVVDGTDPKKPWTSEFVVRGWQKGIGHGFDQVNKAANAAGGAFYAGGKSAFLKSSFGQPEQMDKAKLLATRSYESLKGITADMAGKLNRILSEGISQGKSPRDVARTITKEVEGISRNRAERLARTEIIYAHAEGQLDAFEKLGVEEVGVQAEFLTTGDGRVCAKCREWEGTILTIEEARGLIPLHPSCRCAWIPHLNTRTRRSEGGKGASKKAVDAEKRKAGSAKSAEEKERRKKAEDTSISLVADPKKLAAEQKAREASLKAELDLAKKIADEQKKALETANKKAFEDAKKAAKAELDAKMAEMEKKNALQKLKDASAQLASSKAAQAKLKADQILFEEWVKKQAAEKDAKIKKLEEAQKKGAEMQAKVEAKLKAKVEEEKKKAEVASKVKLDKMTAEKKLVEDWGKTGKKTAAEKKLVDDWHNWQKPDTSKMSTLEKLKLPAREDMVRKFVKDYKEKMVTDVKTHGMDSYEKVYSIKFNGITFQWPEKITKGHDKDGVPDGLVSVMMRTTSLPEKLHSSAKTITFTNQSNSKDPYWAQQYNMPGFESHATGGWDGIAFYRNGSTRSSHAVVHEMGHTLAYKEWGSTNPPSTSAFYAATVKEYEYGQFVSSYASKSIAEDFAESIQEFIQNPDNLKSVSPARYAAIKEILK